MPETPAPAPAGGNRTTLYLLGVVAVLLVVIVAVIVALQQNKNVQQQTQGQTQTPTTSQPTTSAGSMPGVGQSAGVAFDPATATKVPDGEKPEAYVKRYYQAILDKKWDEAFKMQPATSQQGATAADFQSTQTSYGMASFKITNATEQGDAATVQVEQDLGTNGKWGVVWSFQKYEGGWVVQSRKVQMMQ